MIELDGEHHFTQIKGWRPLFETQLRDRVKAYKVKQAGLKLIRVYQPDVWRDWNEWDVKLKAAIEALPWKEVERKVEKRLRPHDVPIVCEPSIVNNSKESKTCKKPKL